jgi:hypothetical protein
MLSRIHTYNFIKNLAALSGNGQSSLVRLREEIAKRSVRVLVSMLVAVLAFGSGTGALSTAGSRSGEGPVPSSEIRAGNAGLSAKAIKTLKTGEASAPISFTVRPDENTVSRQFVANSTSLRVDLEKTTVKLRGHNAGLQLDLLGANSNVMLIGSIPEKSRSVEKGKDQRDAYQQVEFRNIYAGIDAKVSAKDGVLSYMLHFAPGSSPAWVAAAFTGAGKPGLATGGELKFGTDRSGWTVLAPVAYQESNGNKLEVPVNFTLDENGRAGLAVASFDRSKPLTVGIVIKG